MSKKNEKNKYLFDNNLNNQIQMFDLIAMYKLPDEMDLKLYDVVIYEVDDMLIVHRIVEIEEPNEKHPDHRYFKLQGDAVDAPDRFPVLYSQMRGIYKGWKVPFIGSFIMFMQSPAGWLCILLVVGAVIGSPIIDRKLFKHRLARYKLICVVDEQAENEIATTEEIVNTNPTCRAITVYITGSSPQGNVYVDTNGTKIYSDASISIQENTYELVQYSMQPQKKTNQGNKGAKNEN